MFDKIQTENTDQKESSSASQSFPSINALTALYGIGALVSLVVPFALKLDTIHTANSLAISWLFALGCIAIHLFEELHAEIKEED